MISPSHIFSGDLSPQLPQVSTDLCEYFSVSNEPGKLTLKELSVSTMCHSESIFWKLSWGGGCNETSALTYTLLLPEFKLEQPFWKATQVGHFATAHTFWPSQFTSKNWLQENDTNCKPTNMFI